MSSPYATRGGSSSGGGSAYTKSGSRPAKSSSTKKSGGGGLFSHIPGSKIVSQGAKDLYHSAVNTPAGVYYAARAVERDELAGFKKGRINPVENLVEGKNTRAIAKGLAKGTAQDFEHPLRHPGNTALDVLSVLSLGAGGVSRAGALARLTKEGGSLGDAGRILRHGPAPGVRTFKVGDLSVDAPASKSALTRGAQLVLDTRRERAAERNPSGRAARVTVKKAGKALEETLRHEESLAKAPASELHTIGLRLKPHEQWALRLVAEEAPVDRRIAALERQVSESSGLTKRRLAKRLKLTRQAQPLLTEVDGKPALTSARLKYVYGKMEHVAGGREDLGKQLGLLTDESIQGRKTAAGRAALGSDYEPPTPGKLGVPSQSLIRARSRVDRLQLLHDRATGEMQQGRFSADQLRLIRASDRLPAGPKVEKTVPRTIDEARAQLDRLEGRYNAFIGEFHGGKLSKDDMAEQRAINTDNAKFRRQQSGKTRSGRWSGASGNKIARIQKSVKEQARLKAEQEIHAIARKNAHLPAAQTFLKLADRVDELRSQIGRHEEETIVGGKSGVSFGTRTKEVAGKRPHPLEQPFPSGKVVTSQGRIVEPRGTARAERLGGALSVAKDELQRMEASASRRVKPTGLLGNKDFEASPKAVYIPDVEQKAGASGHVSSMGAQGTIGHTPSPIRQGYTGASKRMGREPLQTTKAVAQANLAINRFHRILNLRGKLLKASSPAPRFKNDIAIRLDKLGSHERLPLDVRQFVDNPGELAPDDAVRMFEKLRKNVILAPESQQEFEKLHAEGKIGWVPKRLLGDLAHPAAPLSSSVGKAPVAALDAINNAQRVSILYLKPAYAIPNLLGNAALTLVQQGFAAPRNVAFASRMQWTLGKEMTARVDSLIGEGVAASLQGEAGLGARATQKLAHVWSLGVDRPFRRAAFVHEARVAGYRNPRQIEQLLTDPAHHDDLINVVKRANRELIDYGRLSSRERQVVRRVIFFYPWVKGSTMYAGHFLAEHPVKAGVAGQVGRYGQEESAKELGPTPSYLEGSFKAGGGLVNPTSAAILQTPAQAASAIASLLPGGPQTKASLPAGFVTPALELALALATRQNPQTGHQYKPGESIPKDILLHGLPQYQLAQGLQGKQTSKLYKDTRRSAALKFLVGGLGPRPYDPAYLRQLAGKERAGK